MAALLHRLHRILWLLPLLILSGCEMRTLSDATLSKTFLNDVERAQVTQLDYQFRGSTNGYDCVLRVKASAPVMERILAGAKEGNHERTAHEVEGRAKGSQPPPLEEGVPEWYDLEAERAYPVFYRGGENELVRRFEHYHYLDRDRNVLIIHARGEGP